VPTQRLRSRLVETDFDTGDRMTLVYMLMDQPEIFPCEAHHPRAGVGIERVKVGVTGGDQLTGLLPRVNFGANMVQIDRADAVPQGGSNQLAMIDDGVA